MNFKKSLILLLIHCYVLIGILSAQELVPDCILDYKKGKESYTLIVDKSTQMLHVHSNYFPKPIKSYPITTGKNRGIKIVEGDKKTPEGIYLFKRVIAEEDLPKTDDYGIQAFTLNYPNPIDRRSSRNGSGIWLHGANDPRKIKTPYNTRGCVVMRNSDLIDVSKYIFLNKTVMVIYKKTNYASPQTLLTKRQDILHSIMDWKVAWESKNINGYIGYYAPTFSQKGMNLSRYKQYKKSLNNQYKFISVILSNISLFWYKDYWVSMFDQLYISDRNHFNSKKVQYWQDAIDGSKIVDSINFNLPSISRFKDSTGNFISINEYRKNYLHNLKSDHQLFSAPQILLERLSRLDNQVVVDCRATKINDQFSVIPVLHIKNGNQRDFKTIPGIILKDGIPQSFENSILINKRKIESSIAMSKGWSVSTLSLYILNPQNSFVQINRFNIN